MKDFFNPEDFARCSWEKRKGYAEEASKIANLKFNKALTEARDICEKGASFGIEECAKWLTKWGFK
jgi:hypothetical protein